MRLYIHPNIYAQHMHEYIHGTTTCVTGSVNGQFKTIYLLVFIRHQYKRTARAMAAMELHICLCRGRAAANTRASRDVRHVIESTAGRA